MQLARALQLLYRRQRTIAPTGLCALRQKGPRTVLSWGVWRKLVASGPPLLICIHLHPGTDSGVHHWHSETWGRAQGDNGTLPQKKSAFGESEALSSRETCI